MIVQPLGRPRWDFHVRQVRGRHAPHLGVVSVRRNGAPTQPHDFGPLEAVGRFNVSVGQHARRRRKEEALVVAPGTGRQLPRHAQQPVPDGRVVHQDYDPVRSQSCQRLDDCTADVGPDPDPTQRRHDELGLRALVVS